MRLFIVFLALSTLAGWHPARGQAAARFTVATSSDTLLIGHQVRVDFTLANAEGSNFQPPPFEDFDLVSGPRVSSRMSIVQNERQQTLTYSYVLRPREIGSWWLGAASIEADGEILETQMREVHVFPNPEGIEQDPAQLRPADVPGFGGQGFDLEGFGFEGFEFPGFDLRGFGLPDAGWPDLDSLLLLPPDSLRQKPKRRVYKL